jgi:hypothetical protein
VPVWFTPAPEFEKALEVATADGGVVPWSVRVVVELTRVPPVLQVPLFSCVGLQR